MKPRLPYNVAAPAAAVLGALLGAALPSAATAQSKLEIYGRIDVNVETFNHAPDGQGGSQSVTGMRSGGTGGSRWGLRGTEDLGNGLQVVFDLENGFNISDGRKTSVNHMFNRNAYVALRHRDYGMLGFGRQYVPSHGAIAENSPNGFIAQYEPSPYISPGRADNMLRYIGRFKNGLAVGAYYAFSEQSEQMTNNQDVTAFYGGLLGYNYQNRIRLMVAYDRIRVGNYPSSGGLPANNAGQGDNWLVGGRFDFGNLAVMGGYRYRQWDMLGQSDIKSNLFMVGMSYRYRPHSNLSIGYYHDKLTNAPASMLDNGQRRDSRWHQVAALATYGLSSRTNLYLTAAYAKNGALNLGIGGDGGYYRLAPGKNNQAGAALGIRHVF